MVEIKIIKKVIGWIVTTLFFIFIIASACIGFCGIIEGLVVIGIVLFILKALEWAFE